MQIKKIDNFPSGYLEPFVKCFFIVCPIKYEVNYLVSSNIKMVIFPVLINKILHNPFLKEDPTEANTLAAIQLYLTENLSQTLNK